MSEITPEKVAATPPTVELVADLLTEADNNYHDGHYWKIHLSASGNVVNIGVEASTEPDEDDLDDDGEWLPEVHFRAVVVEGETAPIVLERPDLTDLIVFEGGSYHDDDDTGWQVVPYSSTANWPCNTEDADSILYRTDGDPSNKSAGHISFAEARRFAAALVAVADAAEAAQAENGGTADV